MNADQKLRLLVITPEKTALDQTVDSVRFPLADGQIGILPGRAPLVGRLGFGELKFVDGQKEQSFFLDGGFVQVKQNTVSILTARLLELNQLKVEEAERLLQEALSRRTANETERAAKERDVLRARSMLTLARKTGAA